MVNGTEVQAEMSDLESPGTGWVIPVRGLEMSTSSPSPRPSLEEVCLEKKISFELGQKKCRTSCRNVPESHDVVGSLREGVRFRESIHTCIAKEKVSGRMFEGNLLHKKFELQYV